MWTAFVKYNLFAALGPWGAHCVEKEESRRLLLDKTPFLDSKFDFCY